MSPHVAVIGAGYAGLTAARALAASGVDVTVLEARDRVGGRARTVIDERGAVVDLGAQWFGAPHERLLTLAHSYGLRTVPAPGGEPTVHLGRRRLRFGASMLRRAPVTAFALTSAFATLERLTRRVRAAEPWTAADAEALDAQSLADAIRGLTRDGAAQRVIDNLAAVGLSADTKEISALASFGAIAGSGGLTGLLGGEAEDTMFERGSDAIARVIAAELGDRLRLDHPVDIVVDDDGDVGVAVAGRWGTIRADRVVLAVPPTFAARLLRETSGFRAGMHRGAIVKAVAVYPEAFWRADDRNGMTQAPGDLVSSTFDVSRGGFGMLTALIPGTAAASLSPMSPLVRREFVFDAFERAAGPAARHPLAYFEHAWVSDPWTLGGYGELAPPGLLTAERTLGTEPRGRVHFAGTETSAEWNGYLEGAVRSGERVAAEVLAALWPEEVRP